MRCDAMAGTVIGQSIIRSEENGQRYAGRSFRATTTSERRAAIADKKREREMRGSIHASRARVRRLLRIVGTGSARRADRPAN